MHNDRDANIKCPFYVTYEQRKNRYTISCEPMMNEKQLGFLYMQQTRFFRQQDLLDYIDIFCTDMYMTCPIYKAIKSEKYKEDQDP